MSEATAPRAMRVFMIQGEQFSELDQLPDSLDAGAFVWIGLTRTAFKRDTAMLQSALQRWTGGQLVDLHISDLLNQQLPSHFDYTSWYDLMVFRRLAPGADSEAVASNGARVASPAAGLALQAIETSPVGFAVFDRVLLSLHSDDCAVRDHYAQRLESKAASPDARSATRMPLGTADLMLRMVNHMVDGFLELRRLHARQLAHLQQELLDPRSHFNDWPVLLDSRNALHMLEDVCEDQRSAVQEWIDALDDWPDEADPQARRERELLRVRSRDVLEHVERVLTHARRLEQSAETAVQMHFSALGHRTNDIMRTLTLLTAIFLPLNLITGFFGMNFDSLPLIHQSTGVWVAVLMMVGVVLGLWLFFKRKRFIGARRR